MFNKNKNFYTHKGILMGVIMATILSLLVVLLTGRNDVWIYAIPLGVAIGATIQGTTKSGGK